MTLNRVCSGRSLWQGNFSALLPYPDKELCYPLLNINCNITHGRYLNLTQQHETRTTGAQRVSSAALKPCSAAETASKSWPNRTRWTLEECVKKWKEVVFTPGVSGRKPLVLWRNCFMFALWGGYFVGFDFRKEAGLALRVQYRLLWRTGTLMTCTVWSTGLKYQSNPHHLSSLQEHGLQFLASSSCIFRGLISIAVHSEGNGIVFWKSSKCSCLYFFLKPPFETRHWIFSLIKSKT